MLVTKEDKYKKFFRAIEAFKILSLNPIKGDFLKNYYAYHHHIDDVIDKDAPLPNIYSSSIEFIEDRIDFAKTFKNPKLPIDHLLLYCYELANKIGLDYHEETIDILNSMHFDAKRQGQDILFTKEELTYHFHLLDIRGTVKGTLKLFGEDPKKYNILEPIGTASRLYYNIRDLAEDLLANLINIPAEDAYRLGISKKNLDNAYIISTQYLTAKKEIVKKLKKQLPYNIQAKRKFKLESNNIWKHWYSALPESISEWIKEHAREGMELLKQHKKIIYMGNFKTLTKMALTMVYEKPARNYFEMIVKE